MHPFALATFILLTAIPTVLTDTVADPGAGRPWPLAGLTAFLALSIHWRLIPALTVWLRSPACLLITGVMLISAARAVLVGSASELAFALATLVVLLAMTAMPDRQRACLIAGLALAEFLVVVCLTQPVDLMHRRIGTVHPNHVGAMALAATILVWLSGSRCRWVVGGLAVALMLAVSSRSSLAALALFLVVIGSFWLARRTPVVVMSVATVAILASGIVMLVAPGRLAKAAVAVAALDDPMRGLGSGMTGRMDLWSGFLPQFVENPWDYGYRQRDLYEGAHNGYLNAALEHGLAGAALLASFIAVVVVRAWRRPVLLAALAALLARALTEPNLLNLGDPAGLTFLAVLAYGAGTASPLWADTCVSPPAIASAQAGRPPLLAAVPRVL